MSITAKWYPSAAQQMFLGNLNSTTSSFKIALLNSSGSYTASHTAWSDVSGFQIAASGGYTAGGEATTITPTANSTASYFTPSAVLWTSATFSFNNAVIYDTVSGKLMMHLAFITTQSPVAQDYQINVPSTAPSATPA
jgi:hypothetical protein